MSVLIRGMEIPKNCAECKIKGEGSDSLYTWNCPFTGFEYTRYDCVNDRLDDCPLVEVKVPYGRLIDAYKLLEDHGLKLTEEFAPTVIDAEWSE